MKTISFFYWLKIVMLLIGISLILNVINIYRVPPQRVVKVGVLHSRTGITSFSEIPMLNATLLAIQEINKNGGVLGRPIEPIVADGKSDPAIFAREAKKLITHDKVAVVFGCQTSATRKTVGPIFEQYNSLLFYPVEYEGLEQSPNMVYTGAVPNQHSLPATIWAMQQFGHKMYLIGSDYVYPRATNTILKDILPRLGAEIVGEEYVPLTAEQMTNSIKKIIAAKPDFIFSTIVGATLIPFFQELKAQMDGKEIPIMSSSVDDSLIRNVGIKNIVGSYNSWNYYQSIQGTINKDFVTNMRNSFGKHQVVTDAMEAAYIGVHLWAEAVKRGRSFAKDAVLKSLKETAYKAPEGFVSVRVSNHHLYKTVRIAKISEAGTGAIIWQSRLPVEPEPYPTNLFIAQQLGKVRSVNDWNNYLKDLYTDWGKQWEAP